MAAHREGEQRGRAVDPSENFLGVAAAQQVVSGVGGDRGGETVHSVAKCSTQSKIETIGNGSARKVATKVATPIDFRIFR